MPEDLRRPLVAQDEGADWLYWDVGKRVFRRVVLLAVPSDAPKRVRVQHLDPEMKGGAEWVPAGRLQVPWDAREDYFTALEMLNRLESHAPTTRVIDTASLLLPDYIQPEVADFHRNGAGGVLEVIDVAAFVAILGDDAERLMDHPDSFIGTSRAFLPWPAVERILIALIEANPQPAMRLLDQRTKQQEEFDRQIDEEGERWWMSDEETGVQARRLRQWHEGDLETVALLRRWLSAETPTLAESYIELRGMYTDLAEIVRRAIPRIKMDRSQIAARLAARMEELVDRPMPMIEIRGVRSKTDDEGYPVPPDRTG